MLCLCQLTGTHGYEVLSVTVPFGMPVHLPFTCFSTSCYPYSMHTNTPRGTKIIQTEVSSNIPLYACPVSTGDPSPIE